MIHDFDAIVLGGGAAGLMCAIEAAKRGRRVAVIEHGDRLGKKILISGGGRCNFTNLHCRPENFVSANPHFAKSALARYTPEDFLALIVRHGIDWHEKVDGQLFCDRSARDITGLLEGECRAAGVAIFLKTPVRRVRRTTGFVVAAGESEFRAPVVVVATGGLSIPKIGATGIGYDIARQFGLNIVEPWPALVPLCLADADRTAWCDLAGVAAEVIASTRRQKFRGGMLITHRGLSGPAILQISTYWKDSSPIRIDLAPDKLIITDGANNPATARAALRAALPNRLADRWLSLHTPEKWTQRAVAELERQAHGWEIVPAGTEGYVKAEVTAGGVDTSELSAKTMECRNVPGLFFVGEVVDVTGQLGGFNFQWAWASGFCAGVSL